MRAGFVYDDVITMTANTCLSISYPVERPKRAPRTCMEYIALLQNLNIPNMVPTSE